MPVFSTDANFVSTATDTGSTPPSFTTEEELAALEALKASSPSTFYGNPIKHGGGYSGAGYNKAKALAATLSSSTASPTASSSVAARLRALQIRVGALL